MSEKLTQHEKLDLLIEGQKNILTALAALAKPAESSATHFGGDVIGGEHGPLPTPTKSYAAMLEKYGTPEAFAIEVKKRERGWPESVEAIWTGGWDERQEVIDFKADYPGLFVK